MNLLIQASPFLAFFGVIAAILLLDKYVWSSPKNLAYSNYRDRQIMSHMDMGADLAIKVGTTVAEHTRSKGDPAEDAAIIELHESDKRSANALAEKHNIPLPYPPAEKPIAFWSSWVK